MRLKLALSKGRIEKSTLKLLTAAGIGCDAVQNPERRLVLPLDGAPVDVVLSKAADVPTYVERGACDLGVVGEDVIREHGGAYYEVLDLGFGRCRMALAASGDISGLGPLRVATKYPEITRAYFDSRHRNVEIIEIQGSVELAPILGIADAIMDIVETGETLRQNGLQIVETVFDISARLIVNIAAMKLKSAQIADFISLCKRGIDNV